MNMLSDTDKRRARPSVWPVYVAVAVLLAIGALMLYPVLSGPGISPQPPPQSVYVEESRQWYDFGLGVWGILGLVAAVGLVRLRP